MKNSGNIHFSILVPVYNAEQFLSECIESALNQTYKDFEIILVDDGSTDTSGSICDRFAAIHRNVFVYHTENGGQTHAREFAMRQAKGDFFVFLDADDRLRSNALEVINKAILKHQCDCVIFGYVRLVNGETVLVPEDAEEEVLTNKRDIYRKCLHTYQYNAIWRKAVKATIWGQITSDADVLQIRMGEDLVQSLSVFKNSDKIAFLKEALYEYRDNPNGITYTIGYDAYLKSMGVHELVYQFVKQEQVYDANDFEEFRRICIEKHVGELLRISSLKAPTSDKVYLLKKLRSTEYFNNFVNQGRLRQLPFRRRVLFWLSRWRLDYGIILLAELYAKRLNRKAKQ